MNPKLGKILFITIFILLIGAGTTLALMYKETNTVETVVVKEEINLPPSFVTLPPTEASVGQDIEYIVRTSDQDSGDDELSLVLNESPLWLNMVGGILSGAPGIGDVGYHSVDISVTDGNSTVHQEFYIVVESNDQDL